MGLGFGPCSWKTVDRHLSSIQSSDFNQWGPVRYNCSIIPLYSDYYNIIIIIYFNINTCIL